MALYVALNRVAPLTLGAQRHLKEGFARRVYIMRTNRETMLNIAPPVRTTTLGDDEPEQMNVHVNSYYIHLRGALDNLAWSIQYQLRPLGPFGEEASDIRMKCNLFDRRFLDPLELAEPDLARALRGESAWANEMKDRRDPVAHRVPPYVPPGAVIGKEAERVKALYAEADTAYKNGDHETGMAKIREGYSVGGYASVMVLSGVDGLNVLRLPETVQRDHSHFLSVARSVLVGLGVSGKGGASLSRSRRAELSGERHEGARPAQTRTPRRGGDRRSAGIDGWGLPVRGQQRVDVGDLQAGQPSEHVGQVRLRIDPASSAAGEQRVDDGTAPARVRVPDEEPPLATHCGGSNGILD